ncbi:MAG TPA: SCP2 sterol-binding domain-containing protein [Trinickia sp.]|jgi:predicted lipid carrier protein YhbT|nr:SCP2 sterol-binding domain-containing protein [Trinickia sp.]
MSNAAYEAPSILRGVLSKLPAWPGSLLFAGALNVVLKPHLPADTLTPLRGRALRIDVLDVGMTFDFTYRDRAFRAARHEGNIDLTISASAYDFLQLARRAQDPDTLFFSRRLTMEGDTALGLLVKNSLDAIDASMISLERFAPAFAFRAGKSRHGRGTGA